MAKAAWNNAWLLLTLTILFWAGNVIAARLAIGEVSPMVMTALRWGIASLVLRLFLWPRIRGDMPVLRANWPFILLMGALGFSVYNAMFYTAGQWTSGINMSILQAVTPVVAIVGAAVLYKSPVGLVRLIGIIMALTGVALIATSGELGHLGELQFARGDLLMLVAGTLYAFYTLALRKRPAMSPLGFFYGVSLTAFFIAVPMVAVEIWLGYAIWPSTWKGFAVVAYVGLLPSLIAQVFYIRGVELVGPARAGLFYNTLPVTGALMSVALLGETFATFHILALALVVGGIVLSERYGAR